MGLFTLFAQEAAKPRPRASDLLDRPEFVWGSLGLVAAGLAGLVVLYLLDRWKKQAALADRAESGAELTDFRGMFDRGEITEAEYARLKQKLAGRVKAAADAAPAAEPRAGGLAAPTPVDIAKPTPLPTPPKPPPGLGLSGPLPDDYFDDPPPAAK